ncbi:MAG: hypothetical protein ACR2PO_15970 [Methyloligellaceae bacterium]
MPRAFDHAAGVRIAVPIADRAYGLRDFRIIDLSGNHLSFDEVIES